MDQRRDAAVFAPERKVTQSRKRADERRVRKTHSLLFKRQEPFAGVKEESTTCSGDSAGFCWILLDEEILSGGIHPRDESNATKATASFASLGRG